MPSSEFLVALRAEIDLLDPKTINLHRSQLLAPLPDDPYINEIYPHSKPQGLDLTACQSSPL